ncbi:MAG: putative sulfate transporter [Phycisphaerae bacterium]|nr:putative sulfate transporter [Phycisphaerae bacterium]
MIYTLEKARRDFVAALTVATVALPQGMAYAIIAGLNPVYGLYTAIVSAMVASLMGSSPYLVTGPTNAISLLVASSMRSYMGRDDALSMVFLMTFLVGAVQIAFSLMKFGRMIKYVSHAVVVGFTCGAGVIIALGQVHSLLGVSPGRGYMPLVVKLYHVAARIGQTNPYALGLGLLVIAVMLLCRIRGKRLPGALIGILLAIVLAWTFDLGRHGVKLTGEIPSVLPRPHLFRFSLAQARGLFSGVMAIAIIGLVEAMSISKSLASISGRKVDANREFRGQGAANLVGSFFQCYPASGSFTRSAINHASGAQTRIAGVLSGLLLAAILLLFAPWARYLPDAALAGVIILTGYGMVNVGQIRQVCAAGRSDRTVLWATFGATILMPDLDWAIYMGIAISIFLYLRDTTTVPVRLLIHPEAENGTFREKEIDSLSQPVDVLIIEIGGNLYFGSSEDLERKLEKVEGRARVFVLRLKSIHAIDVTALDVLGAFIRRVQSAGGKVLMSGVRSNLRTILGNTKLVEMVGGANVFLSEDDMFAASRKALSRARELLANPSPPGLAPLPA